MAQTVEQLAKTVGASVDRLLSQMKDAGLLLLGLQHHLCSPFRMCTFRQGPKPNAL